MSPRWPAIHRLERGFPPTQCTGKFVLCASNDSITSEFSKFDGVGQNSGKFLLVSDVHIIVTSEFLKEALILPPGGFFFHQTGERFQCFQASLASLF